MDRNRAQEDKWAKRAMWALVLLPVTLFIGLPSHGQAPDQFIGHEQCKVCHNKKAEGEQWNLWKASKHAQAVELLKGPEAKAVAEKAGLKTPPAESPECLKCHVTAYDAEKKAAPPKIKIADSVQCESCHGASAEHAKDGKVLLFDKSKAATIDVKAHLAKIEESSCTGCHNETSPSWKTDRYTNEKGEKVGFDFKQALAKVTHPNPLKKKDAAAPAK
jgi:hypothetical protein